MNADQTPTVYDLRRERVELASALADMRASYRNAADDPRMLPYKAQIARGEERLERLDRELEELERAYH